MRVVDEEPWSWMLLAEGERRFLSVLCGTVAQYDIDLELTAAEIARLDAGGRQAADEFARAVAHSPKEYWPRHLRDFGGRAAVTAAIAAWRAERK